MPRATCNVPLMPYHSAHVNRHNSTPGMNGCGRTDHWFLGVMPDFDGVLLACLTGTLFNWHLLLPSRGSRLRRFACLNCPVQIAPGCAGGLPDHHTRPASAAAAWLHCSVLPLPYMPQPVGEVLQQSAPRLAAESGICWC